MYEKKGLLVEPFFLLNRVVGHGIMSGIQVRLDIGYLK